MLLNRAEPFMQGSTLQLKIGEVQICVQEGLARAFENYLNSTATRASRDK